MNEMISKVGQWLDKQGFSLEVRTASAFRTAGFEVRQSSYYLDPQTGKPREIDVVAVDPDYRGIINIQFVLECKSSKNPWVLLSSPHALQGYSRLFAFAAMSKPARHILSETDKLKKMLEGYQWFRKDGSAGYSLRQAFSENDVAYTAAFSVANGCNHFLRNKGHSFDTIDFAFPVIAVDTPLLRCQLSETGKICIDEISEGEFLFSGHELGTCIRVVTANRLEAFAVEAKRVADQLRAELKEEKEEILRSWQQS